MNRTKLKNYAPQARRDFIRAVTDRAAFYGLSVGKIEPVTETGDVVIISGRAFPKEIGAKRKKLDERVQHHGFEQTMEALAYTWFNRLVAIRFMELHGYLDHGYRVLSAAPGERGESSPRVTPEILEHAEHVELPGLKRETVIDLKLAGNKEAELYRLLLTAQCNALHTAMPFLFEKIDDETELLLPDNLLHSDSLIRKLVGEIDEEDWREVEIIGWLYQFYISEKKDAVIGKVVASEDIPAATQLFTPNWIVKYLVQNTLGRQWLATYPQSALRQQMQYYIEPAEQTPEVQEQLKAITPTSLNPEELTLLDPACGSGHILVEAYDLFKAIYQERGYRAKDIPALILQKNLFGLEIDDRAAQLAAFALMMKARADDRRLFEDHVQPHVMALVETKDMDAAEIAAAVSGQWGTGRRDEPSPPPGHLFEKDDNLFTRAVSRKALAAVISVATKSPTADDEQLTADIRELIDLFAEARTFGSLIQVPPELAARLPLLEQRVNEAAAKGELSRLVAIKFQPVVEQARLLARQYDAVVANPPYMGSKYYTPTLKSFVNREYREAKADLYACFMERNRIASKSNAFHGMVNIPNWMFLSSFEELRKSLFEQQAIDTFIHNGRGVFGSDFGSCAFVIRRAHLPEYRGSYRRLFEKQGSVASNEELETRFHTVTTFAPSNADFAKIPGSPVAYWVSDSLRRTFAAGIDLESVCSPAVGLQTSDNDRFIRFWHEVHFRNVCLVATNRDDAKASTATWFPLNKGGGFHRWYGLNQNVINWHNDGHELKDSIRARLNAVSYTKEIRNEHTYFLPNVTWGLVTIAKPSFRYTPPGSIFNISGPSIFPSKDGGYFIAFLNSCVTAHLLSVLSPSVSFTPGMVGHLPIIATDLVRIEANRIAEETIELARIDWNSFETSWDFGTLPVLQQKQSTLQQSQVAADAECLARFQRMKQLEEENNRLFIDAYGLQDELSPAVPDDQITLYRPDRAQDIQRLISYALGCLMGRYSLDQPGLIYANSGNVGFDPSQYRTFPADPDGIVPLTETDWFPDDAAHRFIEFLSVAWPKEQLEENLKFVAESLGPNKDESPRETLRRYLATGFYKHHLQIYKRRPIYWLFSSGKQRAFQSLVYLHRYHEGTLARMRTEYVIPLQGKLSSRIDQLAGDIQSAASTSHRKKLEKERDALLKQQTELQTFDEKLRHHADQRLTLDLDDGVKVNYAKFGDLLADVKAVCGTKDDE